MTVQTETTQHHEQAAPDGAGPDAREALAERLFDDVTHALEAFSVYLGVELGLYRALADQGHATEAAVASRAQIAPRYAREWLEQQAAAGYIACDDPSRPAAERRYHLPAEHAEVFLDTTSPYHTVPGAVMLAGVAGILPQLLAAYRSGGGVPYAAYGPEIRRGIAAFNRPMFIHELPGWFAGVPEIHGRLRAAPPARVLELGAGLGAASIALARTYPRLTVLGVDLDASSVKEARTAAADAGVADRVTFEPGDAATASGGPFDLVTIFEALHDMGDPVGVLRTARSALADGGQVFVADEKVADTFPGAAADPVERFQYGWSVLHCLPATLAEDPVEAAGTILRSPTVKHWATQAGFTHFEVLPIENDFWRFYRLHG